MYTAIICISSTAVGVNMEWDVAILTRVSHAAHGDAADDEFHSS